MAAGEFFFTPLVLFIIPKYCHDEFFINLNFFHSKYTRSMKVIFFFRFLVHAISIIYFFVIADIGYCLGILLLSMTYVTCFCVSLTVPCLKIALSKCLGYGIVVGSAMSKWELFFYPILFNNGKDMFEGITKLKLKGMKVSDDPARFICELRLNFRITPYWAKFPHNHILHCACRYLSSRKIMAKTTKNTTPVGVYGIVFVFWY